MAVAISLYPSLSVPSSPSSQIDVMWPVQKSGQQNKTKYSPNAPHSAKGERETQYGTQ